MPPGHKVPGPNDTETVKHIKNKAKRHEVFGRIKRQKAEIKKAKKAKKQKEAKENPEAPKRVPKTLENTREHDETSLAVEDDEVLRDVEEDEFQSYFDGEQVNDIGQLC
jgi:ribosome production factor 1